MTPFDCCRTLENFELFLDQALAPAESEALRLHLEECVACQSEVREFGALAHLVSRDALALTRESAPVPAKVYRLVRIRRLAGAAAAVLVAITAFSLWQKSPSNDAGGLRFHPMTIVRTGASLGSTVAGPKGVQVALGAQSAAAMVQETPRPRFQVIEGNLEVSAKSKVEFEVGDGLLLEVLGTCTVVRTRNEPGTFLIHLTAGSAELVGEKQRTEVSPAVWLILTSGILSDLEKTVQRSSDLLADEGLVVMTSEEAMALSNEHEVERDALEARIGRLQAENERLKIESEVLKARANGNGGPSIRELISALAKEADEGAPWSVERSRRLRGYSYLLRSEPEVARTAILETLLNPSTTTPRVLLGLRLVSHGRGLAKLEDLQPWLTHESPEVRASAVDAIASLRGVDVSPILQPVFDVETAETVRLAAAGALVRHGAMGEPLDVLIRAYEVHSADRNLRRRILGKVLFAPVSATAKFLFKVLTSEDIDATTRLELVEVVERIGGRRAESILEAVAAVTEDPEFAAVVQRALDRVRH